MGAPSGASAVNHRKTPARRAYTLPAWCIVAAGVIVAAAAAGLVASLLAGSSGGAADAEQAVPIETFGPDDSGTAGPQDPTTEPEATEAPEREAGSDGQGPDDNADRSIGVSVFNNTGVDGLAGQRAADIENAGWPDVTTGNWSGDIGENTVFYPAGSETEADLLADDLGIGRIEPATEAMPTDRLTAILSGPQQ